MQLVFYEFRVSSYVRNFHCNACTTLQLVNFMSFSLLGGGCFFPSSALSLFHAYAWTENNGFEICDCGLPETEHGDSNLRRTFFCVGFVQFYNELMLNYYFTGSVGSNQIDSNGISNLYVDQHLFLLVIMYRPGTTVQVGGYYFFGDR